MRKDEKPDLNDQVESDEELLNFDLDDLSLSEESDDELETEEEIIELTDLVERGASEDITQDLKIRSWAAGEKKAQRQKRAEIPSKDTAAMEAQAEDAELDLSDISLEPGGGALPEEEAGVSSGDEITEADIEGLLREEDGITLDLTEDEPSVGAGAAGEITDDDLQALLSETGEQELALEEEEESLVTSDEELQLPDLESSEETQALHLDRSPEEPVVAEEPAVILEKEAEELGAAAALVDEEMGLRVAASGEEEPEEEAEAPEEVEREIEEGGEEVFRRRAFAGISEERMEEIITSVVREVVERVARETMADVAERMIGEAIEALKQSIESSEP
jgi:hypothetical protein